MRRGAMRGFSHSLRSTGWQFVLALGLLLCEAHGLAQDEPAPEFAAVDIEGAKHTLADYAGRVTLLLFWHPENARSRAAVCAVSKLAGVRESAPVVTIVSGAADPAVVKKAAADCEPHPAVLLDPERIIFGDYRVIALPTLLLIDSGHRLKFKIAGFAAEGLGEVENRLDEIYHTARRPAKEPPLGPPEAVRRLGLAQQLLKVGMPQQAEKVLRTLVESHPKFGPAWSSLGYLHIAAGRVEEAFLCLEKAREAGAADVAAGLAWVWWKKGDAAQAAHWMEQAGPQDPHADLFREIKATTR